MAESINCQNIILGVPRNVFLGGGSSSNNNNSRMKSIVRLYLKERCILTIVTFPPPPRPRKGIYLVVSYTSDPCGTSIYSLFVNSSAVNK